MLTATPTSDGQGQATIPQQVREHLGLRPGDRLRFGIDGHGRVVIEADKVSIMDLQGILPRPPRAATVEEMDDVVRRRAAERAGRLTTRAGP